MEDKLILTTEPCCDTIQTCDCSTPIQYTCGEPNKETINYNGENTHVEFVKLAAVLQDSILYSWKLHLKAKKYYIHVILEEYYDEAFDIIDGLIEHYQGICKCDIVGDVIPEMIKNEDPFTYFTNLKDYISKFVNNSNNFTEKTMEIKSDIDDLLRLIDSTLYKLGNLTESKIKSFEEFIYDDFR